MNIRGLYKTSLVDYPGKVSSVIFTGGCNLRCGYCHNPELALNSPALEKIDESEVFAFLEKRKGLLDGITVSGGEPTMDRGLIPFLEKVKSLGFPVKLDTNGFFPRVVSECIEKKLIDYAAVDVKTSPEKYPSLTGKDVSFKDVLATLDILRNSLIDYEIRTTCVPGFVTIEDMTSIGAAAGRVKKYYLQQFVNIHTLLDSGIKMLSPYKTDYLNKLKDEAEKFSDFCSIRGI
ncbi:MAG TPA: anaerobic ribonucleoside-triphosphate reductase activating protein [Spirochaetota bacterium]|nr:anaerobic ribonucleoside-triphosphate reductase activating protein [Spirochaetota bacterium]HPS88216.1 anaerobic ribonucleoside-triphosphate reductase activating protein [Spirochaetota bacterium]